MTREQLEAHMWQALGTVHDPAALLRRLLALADAYARSEATIAAEHRRTLDTGMKERP